jgi:tRNA (cmo5U34)-methyltransferase
VAQFHFDPEGYEALMSEEVPAYHRLQDEVAAAGPERPARTILDLGTGTGVTALRVLRAHPGARLVGIDASPPMLAVARAALPPETDLRVSRLEDPLPEGRFDLVVSALAVHHLDAAAKRDLFLRVAEVTAPGGRFVLGDLIVPDDPADVVTPIDGEYDQPSTLAEQLAWMTGAGFAAKTAWSERDLAVLVGDLPDRLDSGRSRRRRGAARGRRGRQGSTRLPKRYCPVQTFVPARSASTQPP